MFGGKDPKSKAIIEKSFEINWTVDDTMDKRPINRMFINRCRSIVACLDFKVEAFEPFLVIIGGSND